MIVNILAFILVLGVLVAIHEGGHFLMARAVGAPVEVFSIGFGKRLWGFRRGGTEYRVSAVPLGGYVRIPGLGPDESDVVGSESAVTELLPRFKRALILFAGPVTNVAAAVAFVAFSFFLGVELPAYFGQVPVVGWVVPESPAALAGIQTGDRVLAVDGARMETWRDLEMSLGISGGHEVRIEADRSGSALEFLITPEEVTRYRFGYSGLLPELDSTVVRVPPNSPAGRAGIKEGDRIVAVNGEPVLQFYDLIRLISPHPKETIKLSIIRANKAEEINVDVGGDGKIGVPVVFPTEYRKLGFGPAIAAGWVECKRMTVETFRVIGRLFTGKTSMAQLSGPIGIAQISGEAARSGFRTLIWFTGVISLQLGIFNLLPIPILDGGHLSVIALEAAVRRDFSIKVKERILEVGFYLLILLMIVVFYNDIVKIIPESVFTFFKGESPS